MKHAVHAPFELGSPHFLKERKIAVQRGQVQTGRSFELIEKTLQ